MAGVKPSRTRRPVNLRNAAPPERVVVTWDHDELRALFEWFSDNPIDAATLKYLAIENMRLRVMKTINVNPTYIPCVYCGSQDLYDYTTDGKPRCRECAKY